MVVNSSIFNFQMITLLCSYGILVYELLHRETAGAKHGEKSANASHNGMAETIERLEEMVMGNFTSKTH